MQKSATKFAARLRELREEANVSMMELAKAIGVSDAAVCKWENGKSEPKASYIIRLAEYFDCPIEYLLGVDTDFKTPSPRVRVTDGNGKTVTANSVPLAAVTTDEKLIVDTYNKLSPNMKGLLKATLETWATNDGNTAAPDKPKNNA